MSTIQVDRITPFQEASVTIDGLYAPDLATTGSNTFTGDQNIIGTITASIDEGYVLVGGVGNVSALVSTSSFGGTTDLTSLNQYTASNDTKWQTLGFETGSYARLNAPNTFFSTNLYQSTASFENTIRLGAIAQYEILNASGAMSIAASNFATGVSGVSHLQTQNPAGVVNLMFKHTNDNATTIISGSNNIFVNPTSAAAGFNRYMTSGNIFNNAFAVPFISQSMEFSPTVTSNIFGGSIFMRGPSTLTSGNWTISNNLGNGSISIGQTAILNAEKITQGVSIQGNILSTLGNLNIIANQTHLTGSNIAVNANILATGATLIMSSSAITFSQNYVGGGLTTIRNEFFSQSLGLGGIQLANNQFVGATTVEVRGSQAAGTSNLVTVGNNTVGGSGNIIYPNTETPQVVGVNAYHQAQRNFIFGSNLVVTGSSLTTDIASIGSAFIGRNGIDDGIRNRTSDTVFSVGTGASTTVRKTGLRIDSGSNTFVEGTLNVSGSTSTTGSITIQSGSGDLFMYGHKMFNIGAFTSTVTQSGSAAVSQSVSYNTTDISQGVTLNGGGTQLTLTNAGTYNIQFSFELLSATGADIVNIWLKKNGTNVPNSAGRITLANNDSLLTSWNYVVDAIAADYYEIAWQTTNGNGQLLYAAPTGNIPAIPSAIVTVTQVR